MKKKNKNNATSKAQREQKKKLGLRRSASNIRFALRQVWEVSPSYFFLYFFVTFIYAPLDFLTGSFLLRLIVNGIENGKPTGEILTFMAVICTVSLIIYTLNSYYWNVISPKKSRRIGASMQKKLFRKAASVDLACYETPAFYDKYVRAMDEAYDRVMKVMRTIDNLIWRVVSLLCNSFLLFLIDPLLIVFSLFPLLLGVVRRYANRMRHEKSKNQKPIDRRIKYVRRTFYLNEYAKEMRLGGMYLRMLDELKYAYRDFRLLMRKYGLRLAVAQYIQKLGLEIITILGTMLYAAWRTLGDGSMSVGDCIVILNSIGTISYSLNYLVQNISEFGEHALFLEDVRYFLDYESTIVDDPSLPDAQGGEIRLEHVSFRYAGADADTLHDISLSVSPGERIALVGLNGSGKTTLVKLLLRLYDPTEGQVLLNGKDAKSYRLTSYRDQYSCVFQDFKVFSMSVRDNVLLRLPRDGDTERITEALKESGALERISELPFKEETTLTREFDERGANLSIGEQQKISLARVFAEKSPFIILDEPSSALDPIAEHKMFENMMRASEGRSVIFISHRLSSAVDADRIYLLDQGKIVESGTHRALLAENGKYAEMFRLQAAQYVGSQTGKEETA